MYDIIWNISKLYGLTYAVLLNGMIKYMYMYMYMYLHGTYTVFFIVLLIVHVLYPGYF